MAKLQEIDYSTTSTNNTDVDNQSTLGSAPSDTINEIMQKMMKLRAAAITRHVVKSVGTYTAVKTDHNQFWRCTGAVTLNLTAAATLTDGWCLWVRANGGAVTIDPNGAETIDDALTLVLADGQEALIICTGTTFFTVMANGYMVSNDAGAGVGPTHRLFRDSASPAALDSLGATVYEGRDSAAAIVEYGAIIASIKSATAGAIKGVLNFRVPNGSGGTQIPMTADDTSVAINTLLDLTLPFASQIKFGNTHNSADTATLDGYTDWITYTPTFTGFGTVSAVSIWSKRVGDTLYIRGKFTSGISTAVEARMTLGFNGTNANVNSDATKVASIQQAGQAIRDGAATLQIVTLIESSVGYITFGRQDATFAGLTKAIATNLISTGVVMSLQAEIPISGW